MKKLLAVVTVVTVLALGAIAFAHGPEYGGHMGYGYGNHMGYGYGGHMGPGYGHMYGATGADEKFLDETADLRKELHNKRFAYMEEVRKTDADEKKVEKLAKEIEELQEKISQKAPRGNRRYAMAGGYGPCWQQ